MFRIIRRSPWIAVGALGAWLLDANQGPQRRAQVTDQAKRLAGSLMGNEPSSGESYPSGSGIGPASTHAMTESSLGQAAPKEAPGREPVGVSTRS